MSVTTTTPSSSNSPLTPSSNLAVCTNLVGTPFAFTHNHEACRSLLYRRRTTQHVHKRQEQECTTLVQAQIWYGSNYVCCSMHATEVACGAFPLTSPCPFESVISSNGPTQQSSSSSDSPKATTSSQPLLAHSPSRGLHGGALAAVLIVCVLAGCFGVWYLFRWVQKKHRSSNTWVSNGGPRPRPKPKHTKNASTSTDDSSIPVLLP